LSPEYPAALKAEAQLLYQDGDSRAGAVLQKIVKGDPGDQTAQEMLALLQAKQNQCSSANEHFRLSGEAIDSHPGSLERYGDCLMRLRQLEQAIPVFEKLVALEPERAYARYDLALIQRMANRNEQALETLQPLITAKTEDPEVLSLASEAEEAAGDTPDAVSLLRKAIVLNPTDADYYARFAALCLDHDSFQVGIDMLNAGLERIPGIPSLYISRGLLYSELAQYEKAAADFERAEHRRVGLELRRRRRSGAIRRPVRRGPLPARRSCTEATLHRLRAGFS
ncbi:MAG TPA: tetratricopeptide repeat protein, partial [Acidobacteriaceae bacterium]|nr:tetratricopeptide repeat protein [Acidobacteriaceae bacterium]